MKKQKEPTISTRLYLESASDFRITNQRGETISLKDAKRAWDAGQVNDWNIAFHRLTTMNWDIQAVKDYYASQRRTA